MNTLKPGYSYTLGDRIETIYHGVPINGVVREVRRHSIRADMTEISLALAEPVEIYGTPRMTVLIAVLDNGNQI